MSSSPTVQTSLQLDGSAPVQVIVRPFQDVVFVVVSDMAKMGTLVRRAVRPHARAPSSFADLAAACACLPVFLLFLSFSLAQLRAFRHETPAGTTCDVRYLLGRRATAADEDENSPSMEVLLARRLVGTLQRSDGRSVLLSVALTRSLDAPLVRAVLDAVAPALA